MYVHVLCLRNAKCRKRLMNDRVYGFEFNVISNFFLQSILHLMHQVNCRNLMKKRKKKKSLIWCVTGYEHIENVIFFVHHYYYRHRIEIGLNCVMSFTTWTNIVLQHAELSYFINGCHGCRYHCYVTSYTNAYAFISPFKMTHSIDALRSFFRLAISKNANDLHL